jgi:hypothetical protein
MTKSNRADNFNNPLPNEKGVVASKTAVSRPADANVPEPASKLASMKLKPKNKRGKKKNNNNYNDNDATDKKENIHKIDNMKNQIRPSKSGDDNENDSLSSVPYVNGFDQNQYIISGAEWMERINKETVLQGVVYSIHGQTYIEYTPPLQDGHVFKLVLEQAMNENQNVQQQQHQHQQPHHSFVPPVVPGYVCQQGIPTQEGIVMGQYGFYAGYSYNGINNYISHPYHQAMSMMPQAYPGYYQYPIDESATARAPAPVHDGINQTGGDGSINGDSSSFDSRQMDPPKNGFGGGGHQGGNGHQSWNGEGPACISPVP